MYHSTPTNKMEVMHGARKKEPTVQEKGQLSRQTWLLDQPTKETDQIEEQTIQMQCKLLTVCNLRMKLLRMNFDFSNNEL